MTAHSQSDLRAQAAPEQCRRCAFVRRFVVGESPARYECPKDPLMPTSCGRFVALPDGRDATPAEPVEES